jgi:hypothetical protein
MLGLRLCAADNKEYKVFVIDGKLRCMQRSFPNLVNPTKTRE